MSEADAARLLDAINTAFPDPGSCPCEITGCEPDTHDIRQAFRGRPWRTLTDREIDRRSDALYMLDPEPLAYFLPAFLSRVVRNQNSSVTDSLMFYLSLDRFRKLAESLSPAQVDACFAVAEFVFDRDEGVYTEECEAVMRFREELAGRPRTEG